MVKTAKSLESEFHNLCINPERKSRMRSRSFSHLPVYQKKKCRFVLLRRGIRKDSRGIRDSHTSRRDNKIRKKSLLRPAKLNLESSKQFYLKPPTLVLEEDKNKNKKGSFRFAMPSLDNTKLFSYKSVSRNLKPSISADDLRDLSSYDPPSPKLVTADQSESLIASKRENTCNNSCSAQARLESSVPVDCDDTSTEELAGYFDLFVHIPKKMSSMAEMMYI